MNETNKNILEKKEYTHIMATAQTASQELVDGLNILKDIKQEVVSIFGSHVTGETEKDYIHCEKTAYFLGKKGYGVISGGGPGIMKAANSGAMRAKAPSIGFKAKLIEKEQNVTQHIFTHQYGFHYLFVRRYCLAVESKALLFYPGGYGTFNELFEYLTLIKTEMEQPVPVILVNKRYWKGLFAWIKKETLKRKFVDDKYLENIYFVNTQKEILEIIEKYKKTE